jgi:Na+/proline symporter
MGLFTGVADFLKVQVRTPQFIIMWVAFIIFEIGINSAHKKIQDDTSATQWHWLALYAVFFISLSPIATTAKTFFKGNVTAKSEDNESAALLTFSCFISWIFAKSIRNTATTAAKYGTNGGWAYAGWYVSFFSASAVIYRLRKQGYKSLPEMIHHKYGSVSLVLFALALFYRLWQEVWSNARVIAAFYTDNPGIAEASLGSGGQQTDYGNQDLQEWFMGGAVSVAIPLIYVMMGGMRSSLISDGIQAVMAMILLFGCLIAIGSELNNNEVLNTFLKSCSWGGMDRFGGNGVGTDGKFVNGGGNGDSIFEYPGSYNNGPFNYDATTQTCPTGPSMPKHNRFTLPAGLDMMIAGMLQGAFSYPFFDPVLTDRCFMASPKVMVRSFYVGGSMAVFFIFFFGLIGTYGNMFAMCHCVSWSGSKCLQFGPCAGDDWGTLYGNSSTPYVNGANLYSIYKGEPAAIGRSFGEGFFSVMNIIMMSSSISTLDSTFSSLAKLAGPDLAGFLTVGKPIDPEKATAKHMLIGRVAMVVFAVFGVLYLLRSPDELSATTVSGVMVFGLGPPIYMQAFLPQSWTKGYKPLAFIVPCLCGYIMGVYYNLKSDCHPTGCEKEVLYTLKALTVGEGAYGYYLGFTIAGTVGMLAIYMIMIQEWCWFAFDEDKELVIDADNNEEDNEEESTDVIKNNEIEATLDDVEAENKAV